MWFFLYFWTGSVHLDYKLYHTNVDVSTLTLCAHVHVYILEKSQHKVPEEALKVRITCNSFSESSSFLSLMLPILRNSKSVFLLITTKFINHPHKDHSNIYTVHFLLFSSLSNCKKASPTSTPLEWFLELDYSYIHIFTWFQTCLKSLQFHIF